MPPVRHLVHDLLHDKDAQAAYLTVGGMHVNICGILLGRVEGTSSVYEYEGQLTSLTFGLDRDVGLLIFIMCIEDDV